MGFPLTEQQRAVVENRGGGLLVSAAAGSGKTSVLVERLLTRVEEEGVDIDRFLVITYTKAAAAELRGRIVEELAARLAERPGDRRLRRQATLVYQTQISTIHSFCAQLLRECGYRLDLDPDFRLCDEAEAEVLMLQAIEDVLDGCYEEVEPESDFARLLDTMSAGRDDSRLIQITLDIYRKVQSHPAPRAWLAEQLEAFGLEGVTDAGATPWGALLLENARKQAEYWQGQMEQALALTAEDEKLSTGYAPSLSATIEGLEAFHKGASQSWDQAVELAVIPFPRLGAVRGCEHPAAQERIKAIRERCKKRMGKVSELLSDSSATLLEDMRQVYPAVRGLFTLVEDFSAVYAQRKRERGLLDFSDLEHFAVALLVGKDGEPTELAGQWAARYEEIMVDEYQDTNEVQNAIFNSISRDGRHLFMVGDVKQSIYRFRLADPTIFLKKYRTFRPHTQAEAGEPRRILLSTNFRSRPEVLEGANFLFRNVMSTEFGEMDYTDDEALYPGASFPGESNDYLVELDALDLSRAGGGSDEESEKVPRDLMEARFTARRIRDLLDEGFPLTTKSGGLRPATPGDVVILLRSPGTALGHYTKALGELELPWEAGGGGDFLSSTEASVALSYLQIIDNPRQDVPLISVLRSPAYGFSADRLAEIRAESGDVDFYTALCQDDGEDTAAFLAELELLRDRACDMSCYQLLRDIYDRTNLLGLFSGAGDGDTRRGNLLALAECARSFEEAGHKGLFGFLSYLERVRENGSAFVSANSVGSGGGVRILSIHKSKGLEFPIVFLCGLARRLNREDMQKPMLFHPKLGVGPKGLDIQRMIEFPTLARKAVAAQLEREMMAEELRLLYVAMTRAKEKLILVCSLIGGSKDLQRLSGEAGCPVEPQALLGTQSVGQWVLLPVLARPDAGALLAAAEVEVEATSQACGPRWDIRWIDGSGLEEAPGLHWRQEEGEAAPILDPGLESKLLWQYPQWGDVEIPSKLTATQLKGRVRDEEILEAAVRPTRAITFARPQFAVEELGLTPAQRGTALHMVMQFIDFARGDSVEGVEEEIHRLTQLQIITLQQGQAVEPGRIVALLTSPIGREMISSGTLQREFKFSILAPAKEYYPQAGEEEEVLLQGVVDCWFETPQGITVLDFKTDRVSERTVLARAAEYQPQLTAYSRALEEVTGKRVYRKVLWFFALDRAVEI